MQASKRRLPSFPIHKRAVARKSYAPCAYSPQGKGYALFSATVNHIDLLHNTEQKTSFLILILALFILYVNRDFFHYLKQKIYILPKYEHMDIQKKNRPYCRADSKNGSFLILSWQISRP